MNGESRLGPRFSITRTCSTSVPRPPTPVAIDTPTRSGSLATSSFESVSACDAAAVASCAKRSVRRASFLSMYFVGSKSLTSPAICDS